MKNMFARFALFLSAGLLATSLAARRCDAAAPGGKGMQPGEPGLLQLYPFDEGEGLQTRNLVESEPFGSMAIAGRSVFGPPRSQPHAGAADADDQYPRWVTGRWPGKAALSIGTAQRSVGRTHFHGVEGKDFTVSLWVRTPSDAGRMVFASVGDGYSKGWRLNSSGRGIEFILGRKPGTEPGEGMVAVQAGNCLRPQVWQQIVAVLNGDRLQLFVDGRLAAEKPFDGRYAHVATPAARVRTPELDFGGLQLGSTDSQKSLDRFDIDELAIFSRALDASRIAELYADGDPGIGPEAEVKRHQEELVQQRERDAITLALPSDTFGYFAHDQVIPVALTLGPPAAPLFEKPGTCDIEISRLEGEALAKATLPLTVGLDGGGTAEYAIQPDRCGLYVLSATVRDHAGRTLKHFRIDFARRLPLPPREGIPATSMLESYVGVDKELPVFGTTIERIIQPIYGRAPDGGANFAGSDAFVEKCSRKGLDILYCINIGFWENGRYKTVDDWKADPRIHTDHVRALVSRYKGRVKYWEILNEPNAHDTKVDDYVALLEQAHDIIREVDPGAKIVGPCGTSNYHDWTEQVLAAGGGRFLDILSFHNYLGMSPLKNHTLGRVEAVKASMRTHLGRELPMWNSECGIHQPARIDSRPATDEDILKVYGGRARRDTDGVVTAGVDAITMVNEHVGACWTAQSLLVERAEGVLKHFMLMRPSQLWGDFSGGDERVTEKGVALAAAQSLLIQTTAARFLPAAVGGACGVVLTGRDGKTHVALFADRKTRMVFSTGLAEAAGITAVDFLGNPFSVRVGADGLVPLDLGVEPVYLLDVPPTFTVNSAGLKLTCGLRQVEPMSQVKVVVEVRNPSGREVRAAVVPEVSAGVAAAVEKEFTLAPGESRSVPISWRTGGIKKGRHWMRVQLHVDGQLFSVAEHADFFSHGTMSRIPRLPGDVILDGDPAEWADMPAETADTRERAVIGRPVEGAGNPAFWDGPKDLSFTVKTGWTESGIHFLIDVTDNVLRPATNGEEDRPPWHFDCVELFLDARPQQERQAAPTAGAVQACVALRLGDTAAECPVRLIGKEPLPATLRCVARKTAAGYLVEGTISPAADGPWNPADGTQLNLDFTVDDNDDSVGQAILLGRRVQMALHGTAGNHTDTSNYGRYLLSAETPQPNLVVDGSLGRVPVVPASERTRSEVPGWRIPDAEKNPPAAQRNLFWGARRVDGRNALWIGTSAEAHLETAWEQGQGIRVKEGAGYAASCQLRGQVDGEATWAHCRAIVFFLDDKGRWLGHQELGGLDVQKNPGRWRACGSRFITPAGTATIRFRGSILSKGVKGFADYAWTDFELREILERQSGQETPSADPEMGRHVARTMTALATSTPEKRNRVRMLFYGQSITAQAWSHQVATRLKDKYFSADVSYENRAIGGFGADRLVKTARQDLYPFYPDLVIFHVYGGGNGEWEQIIRDIRTRTTAEIVVATHHLSHQGNAGVARSHDAESTMIREIAAKYDCELVDVREEWRRHLADNGLEIKAMLGDDIHLNDRGCELMAELVWKHLQHNPSFANPHADWIRRLPVVPAADGSITVGFTGNRVDIVADTPVAGMGTARLLIDGQPPSANAKAYAFTRPTAAPGVWWPAIYTLGSEAPVPQAEEWKLTITDMPAEGPFRFSVSGSKTGPDGSGTSDERFVSDSRRIVIEAGNYGIASAEAYTKRKCPAGFEISWKLEPMCIDTYVPPEKWDPALENGTRVTQLIENGPHTLTIIPNGDGPVPIKAVIVYEPPLTE